MQEIFGHDTRDAHKYEGLNWRIPERDSEKMWEDLQSSSETARRRQRMRTSFSRPMNSRERGHTFRFFQFSQRSPDQRCTVAREIASEDPRNIEQRTAATNQANIMRAVADHITFCTQHGILEGYGISRTISGGQAIHIRPIHDSLWEDRKCS
jgi:hypothetical protein